MRKGSLLTSTRDCPSTHQLPVAKGVWVAVAGQPGGAWGRLRGCGGGSLGSRVPVIWLVEGKLSFFLVSSVCWKRAGGGSVCGILWAG